MKPRLVAILSTLVLAPLLAAAFLGLRTTRDEQKLMRHRFEALLSERLADVDGIVARVIEREQAHLSRLLDRVDPARPDASLIRELVRGEPLVQQIFVLDAGGKLSHPPPEGPLNQGEQAFLERTRPIWERGEHFFYPRDARPAAGANAAGPGAGEGPGPAAMTAAAEGTGQGWHTYYLNQGENFIFWRRVPGSNQGAPANPSRPASPQPSAGQGGKANRAPGPYLIGAELDRLALLGEVIGELPDTDPGDSAQAERSIRLLDTRGRPIYLWGSYQPGESERPLVTRELRPPLGAFRLHYFAAPGALGRGLERGARFGILASIGALALAIIGLALYFLREAGREAREAEQRVSFVNQVSHELKTPLTNIRMYAELLEDQIDEDEPTARSYLGVIVSESQRLSRLIGNVLSFARQGRRALSIHPSPGRIDSAIENVLEQFRPGFDGAGIAVELELGPDRVSRFDADALGQILGNLLSNVEKYAASGRWVRVALDRQGDDAVVTVSDRGPGVSRDNRNKIFLPFFRLSDRTTDGVTGAGIGLTIARELARLHGGSLSLERGERGKDGAHGERGAAFRLVIRAPLQTGE